MLCRFKVKQIIAVIAQLKGENLTSDFINGMEFFEKCTYQNLNPVLLARHFQYRIEVLFKVIVLNG